MKYVRTETKKFVFEKFDINLEHHFTPIECGKGCIAYLFDGKVVYENLVCKNGDDLRKVQMGYFTLGNTVHHPTIPVVIKQETAQGTDLDEFVKQMKEKYENIEIDRICPKKGRCINKNDVCSLFDETKIVVKRSYMWFVLLGLFEFYQLYLFAVQIAE